MCVRGYLGLYDVRSEPIMQVAKQIQCEIIPNGDVTFFGGEKPLDKC